MEIKNNLVCYFSSTGTTKEVAQKLAEAIEGDLFEITPKEKYTSEDLDWTNKESRSTKEMESEDSKPEIESKVPNINEYQKIILGFPVWWYREPSITDTFIEENDLENKEVYIFITSLGSSVDRSLEHLKNKYNNINFISGKRLTSNVIKDEILEWINK